MHTDGIIEEYDTTFFEGLDSIRITDTAGLYVNNNIDTASVRKIEFRSIHESWGGNGPTVSDTAAFVMEGHFAHTITVNGTTHGTVEEPMTDTTCGVTGHFTQTFTNLPMDQDMIWSSEGCPASGSISLAINLAADCPEGVEPDSGMTVGNWTVTISFSGGQMHLTAFDGTTTWTMNDWCGPDPTDLSSSDSVFVAEVLNEQLGSFFFDIPTSETLLDGSPASRADRRSGR